MFEFIIFVSFLFVFFYSKNRADQLRDEISSLRARLGDPGREEGIHRPESVNPRIGVLPETAAAFQATEPVMEKPPVGQEPLAEIIRKEEATPVASDKKEPDGEGLEFKLGSKVFTAVGVVAVIFAVGFFLRYAFENNLINEYSRVALGVAAGLALVTVGEITRKRYPKYGQALTGGGLGVLYLSFYAAFSFYQLLAQPAAFFMMILVTAGGILLALRQNSMGLATFAQIGGFLTPLLIDSGNGSPHILFLYVALLDIAVFLIAFYKLWPPLSVISFVGTAISFLYWHSHFYSLAYFTAAQGYLTLFFVLFLAIPFIQYFVKKSPENSWDLALVAMNPFFYFLMSYALIDPLHPDLTGWFTIALGALYCALAAAIGGENERESRFRHFLLTPGFVLLAVAIPIQFDGKWIAVAWAAESLAFISTGFKLRFPLYRVMGNILFVVAALRIIFIDGRLPVDATAIVNGRFASYLVFIAFAAAAAYIYRKKNAELGEDEKQMFSFLALEAALMAIVGSSVEIRDFVANYGQWTVAAWSLEALALVVIGFKIPFRGYRVLGICLFFLALARVLFVESYLPRDAQPIFNIRLLAWAAFFAAAVAAAYIYRRRKTTVGEGERQMFSVLAFSAAFAGLAGLTFEIHDFFGSYWYPILWTAGGLVAGALSFRLNNVTLRTVTYLTFAASFFRLIFFETHLKLAKAAQYIPIFNTRVFAFLASAAAIRYFLALLRRHKDKLSAGEYDLFQPVLFVIFHLLLLWMVSAEIVDYCDHRALLAGRDHTVDFDSLKNVLLSVAWAVYGGILLAVGIFKKAVYERFLAITLFCVVIFKVFLIDTADLNNLYRFFSFITLGCILLLTGYLYYRYQDRIRKFVKGE
jgi:uncharacterized membrane protein